MSEVRVQTAIGIIQDGVVVGVGMRERGAEFDGDSPHYVLEHLPVGDDYVIRGGRPSHVGMDPVLIIIICHDSVIIFEKPTTILTVVTRISSDDV